MKARFTYVGIRVQNLQQSIHFYTQFLGMKVIGQHRYEHTKGETVGLQSEADGFVLELNYYEKDSPHYTEYTVGEGLDHLAFKVDDLTTTLEAAQSNGYTILQEITADGNQWAYIEDPNGIWIELY